MVTSSDLRRLFGASHWISSGRVLT
jgi:hypothetical protein